MSNRRIWIELGLWVAVVLLSILYAVLLSINLWGLRPWGEPLDRVRFGTWTQAMSSAGTMCAVIVALVSLLWQQAKTRKENNQKATDEQTAIFLWLASQLVQDSNSRTSLGRQWDLEIQNLTKAPIYRWRVEFQNRNQTLSDQTKRPLLPDRNVFNMPVFDDQTPQQVPPPTLYFQSRDGRVWKRSATGVLAKAKIKQLEPGVASKT
jgi:hypothetical protein